MKFVLLMRHAKSSWKDSRLKDFDRPLNERGNKDAPRMAKFLEETGSLPEHLLASPARRVVQTTKPIIDLIKNMSSPLWDEQLYYGSTETYLNVLLNAASEFKQIMLIGHNPMMEDLVGRLNHKNSGPMKMSTAAIACFEFDIENWKDLKSTEANFKWYMTPKKLKNLS